MALVWMSSSRAVAAACRAPGTLLLVCTPAARGFGSSTQDSSKNGKPDNQQEGVLVQNRVASDELPDDITRELASTVFHRLDRDGDGSLDRDEYDLHLSFDALKGDKDTIARESFVSRYPFPRYGGGSDASKVGDLASHSSTNETISWRQHMLLGLNCGIPFVGFGFCDNALMIMAGESIENSIGVALAISTLAAAGLGNLVSDVVGIAASDYIERMTSRLGIPAVVLSDTQRASFSARCTQVSFSSLGIAIGCLLGMFPLLFIDMDAKELRSAFNDADEDGDGFLDMHQATFAFHRAGYRVSDQQVKELIYQAMASNCDTNPPTAVPSTGALSAAFISWEILSKASQLHTANVARGSGPKEPQPQSKSPEK